MKRTVVIVSASPMDEIMHRFDVFEPFKRLIGPVMMLVVDCKRKSPKTVIDKLRKAWEGATHPSTEYKLLAMFIVDEPRGAYIDESCKMVSNGQKFGMFADTLKQLGYKESA